MGAIFSSPKGPPGKDPALVAAEKAAADRAEAERLKEEETKREEQAAFGANLRGRRSLLSGSFTGFGQRGVFAPTGGNRSGNL